MKSSTVVLTVASWLFHGVLGARDYTAAVVEYHPTFLPSEKETVSENVNRYEKLMEMAKSKKAEIIVFPEYGLNARTLYSEIPHPSDNIAPCDDTSFVTTQAVKDLSAASKKNKIYSVVNMLEKRECEKGEKNCPDRGYFVYNTNVVFDRSGVVIGRYAKFNLFDEKLTNTTECPELVYFDTDFGVRFGTFICFDILFRTPPLRLIQQYRITDFVFSTCWFSELPFLTALQAQRGWAETNNVNLLASGYNHPKLGSSGSGIYNGKFGALVEIFPESNTTKLLVAKVPRNQDPDYEYQDCEPYSYASNAHSVPEIYDETENPEKSESELALISDQIRLYESEVIGSGKRSQIHVCSMNDFCCKFQVKMETLTNDTRGYNYRAMAFDGVRSFGLSFTGGVQSCGVVLCNGPSVLNCTARVKDIPGLFKFTEIKISAHFPSANAFQMPSTLTDGKALLPLPDYKYSFQKKEVEGRIKVNLDLVWPVTDLRTFAIYGRNFVRDGEIPFKKSGAPRALSLPVGLFPFVVFAVFRR